EVTPEALRDFIPQFMDELVANTPLQNLTQSPEFEPALFPKRLVICTPPSKLYPVTIPLPPAAIGRTLQVPIISGRTSKVFLETKPMTASLRLDLPRGVCTGQFSDKDGTIMTASIEVPQKLPGAIQFAAE